MYIHVLCCTVDTPVITTQPAALMNQIPGTNVQFSVVATGDSLTYQWQMDGVALTNGAKYSGVDTNMLQITNIQFPADEGSFNVIVSNGAGSETSNSAMLDIGMQTILADLNYLPHLVFIHLTQLSPS